MSLATNFVCRSVCSVGFLSGYGSYVITPSQQNICTQTKKRTVVASELELELIQTQMAQKPMLRAEVYAHAMRASQNRKKEVRREKKV